MITFILIMMALALWTTGSIIESVEARDDQSYEALKRERRLRDFERSLNDSKWGE